MDIYDRERLSYLQRGAADNNLTGYESRELAGLVLKLAAGVSEATTIDGDADPGEIRLADKADDVGSAHLAVVQAKRNQRLLALPPIVSLVITTLGMLLMEGLIFAIGAIMLALSVGLIATLHVTGNLSSVGAAEKAERRAEVAYARLHRRLPDATDRAIASRQIEAAKAETSG